MQDEISPFPQPHASDATARSGRSDLERLGQIARGVAHDFNNLLTVILGCIDQVRAQLPPDAPIRSELDTARTAGHHAAQLVAHVLRFGRPRGPSPADWNGVVRSAQTFLVQMVGSRVHLEVEAAPGLWPVFVDPLELWQLLINLVGNAAAAMPDGGRIVVRTGNESLPVGTQTALSHLPAGDYAVLRVIDDGRGMDAATQARMFEPFFSTRGVDGAGLGLSTVARIVTDAAGGLRVSSAPGRGTTVEIWLPRCTIVG